MTAMSLVERVRAALGDHQPRETRMFGGTSFLVGDHMVVAARGSGELLVRIDPGRRAELLAEPGARPATMGASRTMGDGWLAVDESALGGDALARWVEVGLATRPDA